LSLFYFKKEEVLISDEPSFPDDSELDSLSPITDGYITLDEWKTYHIKFIREVPDTFNQAPFITKRFDRLRIFEINFKNYVGLTRIGNVHIKIKNNKIGEELYDSILKFITCKYANLVFSFNKSVGLGYKKDKIGKDIAFLQYIFLKTFLLDHSPNIDEIFNIIHSMTHKKLISEYEQCMINEVDDTDIIGSMQFLLSPDNLTILPSEHPLALTILAKNLNLRTLQRYYPKEARRTKKYYTFDTNENRFTLFFLKNIVRLLTELENSIVNISGTYLNPDISSNIGKMRKKIAYFLSNPMWNEVGVMKYIPMQSTILQKKDGYRQLFRLYSLMQLSLRYQFFTENFRNLIEIKDIATLYEYWCFFLVKDVIEEKYRPLRYNIIVSNDATEEKLIEGLHITYEHNIDLYYNYTASGSQGINLHNPELNGYEASDSCSHNFRPDIVITRHDGKKLVLDAKYKGRNNSNGFYGNEDDDGTIQRYKEEDLDKMHTYRDALKNVSGAFALYPGNNYINYPSHGAKKKFQGVGALPLRPVSSGKPNQDHIGILKYLLSDFFINNDG